LSRMASDVPDLADVMHRAGVAEHLGRLAVHAAGQPEARAQRADPLDVAAGVGIAKLGRVGQADDHLELTLAQFFRASVHFALEDRAVEAGGEIAGEQTSKAAVAQAANG